MAITLRQLNDVLHFFEVDYKAPPFKKMAAS